MRVLVTGAGGFVGRNLTAALKSQSAGGRERSLAVEEVLEVRRETPPERLEELCARADFVFHLAGVNRPAEESGYLPGNLEPAAALIRALKKTGRACPVFFASSVQAARPEESRAPAYGRAKRAVEELFFRYGEASGAPVLVCRLPNLFGKWCRPDYNSAVATFCARAARDLPIPVHDPAVRLELLYIDDLVAALLDALEGRAARCRWEDGACVLDPAGPFCFIPGAHSVTLGEIAALLERFRALPETRSLPEIPPGSFAGKLYSTYLTYLPEEKTAFPLPGNTDGRGSFTELLRTASGGQFSLNVAKPGVTKGRHWHQSKWELFIVVSGRALIRQRPLEGGPVLSREVDGKTPEAVVILPGYTHSITNLSRTEDLITLMWASEPFDSRRPDTFPEPV